MLSSLRLREAWTLGGLRPRELVIRTWGKLNEHELMTRAAAISYYALIALIPFLALVLAISAQILPDLTRPLLSAEGSLDPTGIELRRLFHSLFPDEAYQLVAGELVRLQKGKPVKVISLGIVVTLWLASSLFIAVFDAMNVIYGVRETRPYWKLRIEAMSLTLVMALILIFSLASIVIGPEILARFGLPNHLVLLATVAQWCLVSLILMVSFAITFYYGPDAEQRWEWISPGSVAGTIGVILSSVAFRIYVQNWSNYNATYGSLGGVVMLLGWMWVCAFLYLVGAEVNKVIEDASSLGKNYGQKCEVDLSRPI